jgi:hypothetical protein
MPRRFGYYDTIKAYHEYLIKLKEAFTMKEFYIAGVQFHEAPKIQDKLKEGMQLTLRPEPSNKYDPNAVAIIYNANGEEDDTMIGYVPAKFSGEISADILTSDHITCTLTEVNLDAKTWERFKVIIKDEEVSDA